MALAERIQQHEIQTRLHTLGVTAAHLREAVSKGVTAQLRTTRFHPPSAPGFYRWSEIVVALRQIYVPRKWEANDVGGLSTIVSPDGAIAIAVATGSDRTGRPGLPDPETRYPRGSMTQAAVRVNQQTRLDLTTGETIVPKDLETMTRVTWWLLVHVRRREVRLELSCPWDVGED